MKTSSQDGFHLHVIHRQEAKATDGVVFDRTITRPDDGAVDYAGTSISLRQFGQSFKYSLKHADLYPAPISAENAVLLDIFVR